MFAKECTAIPNDRPALHGAVSWWLAGAVWKPRLVSHPSEPGITLGALVVGGGRGMETAATPEHCGASQARVGLAGA